MSCIDGTQIDNLEKRIGKLPDNTIIHYNGEWYVKAHALKGVVRQEKSRWLPKYYKPKGGIDLTLFTCMKCGYKTFSGSSKYCPNCGCRMEHEKG